MSDNLKGRIIDNGAKLVERLLDREELRALCIEYQIHFNMKSIKADMSRKVVNHWLESNQITLLTDTITYARDKWQYKLDSKDRHDRNYYTYMRDIGNHTLSLLEGLNIDNG